MLKKEKLIPNSVFLTRDALLNNSLQYSKVKPFPQFLVAMFNDYNLKHQYVTKLEAKYQNLNDEERAKELETLFAKLPTHRYSSQDKLHLFSICFSLKLLITFIRSFTSLTNTTIHKFTEILTEYPYTYDYQQQLIKICNSPLFILGENQN